MYTWGAKSLCQKLDQSLREKTSKIQAETKDYGEEDMESMQKLVKNISEECLEVSSEQVTILPAILSDNQGHPPLTEHLIWSHTGHVGKTAQPPSCRQAQARACTLSLPKKKRLLVALEEILLNLHP